MTTLITGAFGCIGAWVIRGLLAGGERPVVSDRGDDPWRVRMIARPEAPQRIVIVRGEQPIPFPDALDDTHYQKDLGPVPATSLAAGVRQTLDEFTRLQREGRLDARELT